LKFNRPQSTQRQIATQAVRVVDWCLIGCLFVAPLWFGGRHDLGRLLYSGFVAAGVIAWTARCLLLRRPMVRWSAAHLLLLAAVGLVVCQLVPLSPANLGRISPGLASIAPAWTSQAEFPLQLGQWTTVSLTPYATQVGLAVLLTHALLFCLVVERLETEADVHRLLNLVALAAASMAAFGLLQWLTSNGKLLWFYEHPQRAIGEDVQGSFANKNHFAHFVVLGLGPIIVGLLSVRRQWQAAVASRRTKPVDIRRWKTIGVLWAVALVATVVAVLLSLSRGGWIAGLVAIGVGGLVLLKQGAISRGRLIYGAAGLAAAVLLVVSFGDMERLTSRVDSLGEVSLGEVSLAKLDRHAARRTIWAANIAAAKENPWLGYGVGSHADVYPAFMTKGFDTQFTHAESGYLHTLTETGIVGGLLLLTAIGLVGYWCVGGALTERDPQRLLAWAAIAASMAASVVHSLADFVWYLPACMCVTVLLAACALRLHQTAGQESTPNADGKAARNAAGNVEQTAVWYGAPIAASLLVAIWAASSLWGPAMASVAWDHYQRSSVIERQLVLNQLYKPASNPESDATTMRFLKQQMIQSLRTVIDRYPGHAQARLRLAGRLLQQFELEKSELPNAMGLVHLRETVLASRFASRTSTVEWLHQAFGPQVDRVVEAYDLTRIALSSAPLQGDGYSYLATTNFLAPPQQRDIDAIMQQALALRPEDGGILFEAGRQALIGGKTEQALEHWLHAHQLPGSHIGDLVWMLTQNFPAQVYLIDFEPDWPSFVLASRHYRLRSNPADLQAIAAYSEQLAGALRSEQPRNCARAWKLAGEIAGQQGDVKQQARCMSHAVEVLPTDYAMRHELAKVLVESEQYAQAVPHLRWCLDRRPANKGLHNWLRKAESETRSAQADTTSTHH